MALVWLIACGQLFTIVLSLARGSIDVCCYPPSDCPCAVATSMCTHTYVYIFNERKTAVWTTVYLSNRPNVGLFSLEPVSASIRSDTRHASQGIFIDCFSSSMTHRPNESRTYLFPFFLRRRRLSLSRHETKQSVSTNDDNNQESMDEYVHLYTDVNNRSLSFFFFSPFFSSSPLFDVRQ